MFGFLDDLRSNPWAYLPPRSSLWLWIGAPILVAIIYSLTMRSTAERRKRLREAEIWRASITPERADETPAAHPYRPGPKAAEKEKEKAPKKAAPPLGPPRVPSIPALLDAMLRLVGGGEPIAHYELVKGIAYLSLVEANQLAGSDYQTVTGALEERGPSFTVRPLPVVDGLPVANTGVQFKKDPDLMSLFLIEGTDAKAIGKWLSPSIRRALCEVPTVWLRVTGTTMTVTTFGAVPADELDKLVELADAIFAEHGAEGGPSLFGDDEDGDRPPAPAAEPAKPTGTKPADKKRPPPATATTHNETPSSKKRA